MLQNPCACMVVMLRYQRMVATPQPTNCAHKRRVGNQYTQTLAFRNEPRVLTLHYGCGPAALRWAALAPYPLRKARRLTQYGDCYLGARVPPGVRGGHLLAMASGCLLCFILLFRLLPHLKVHKHPHQLRTVQAKHTGPSLSEQEGMREQAFFRTWEAILANADVVLIILRCVTSSLSRRLNPKTSLLIMSSYVVFKTDRKTLGSVRSLRFGFGSNS